MTFDSKQLSEQSVIKSLLVTKTALGKNFQKCKEDNQLLNIRCNEEKQQLEKLMNESEDIRNDIMKFDSIDFNEKDKKYIIYSCNVYYITLMFIFFLFFLAYTKRYKN